MTTINRTTRSPQSSQTNRTTETHPANKPTDVSTTNPRNTPRLNNDVSSFSPTAAKPLVVLQPTSLANTTAADAVNGLGGGTPPEQLTVNAEAGLNLRSLPSASGNDPIAIIPNGASVQVTPDATGVSRRDGFVHVSWNDNGTTRSGWVSEQYTQPAAGSTTTPPTTPPPTPQPGNTQGLTVPSLNLELGSTGTGVQQLQQGLVQLGYMSQEQVTAANGTFDATTQQALQRFQQEHNVSPAAGYFGPLTREALRTALGLPRPLGTLSQNYESNGDPGAVSSGVGDYGGVSYGAYQFSTNAGSAQAFTNWLQANHPEYGQDLAGKTPGTQEYSEAWRQIAARDPEGFLQAQHDYVQAHYYEAAKADINTQLGLDLSTHSQALNDVLWSTAVQHGTGGATEIFRAALAGKDVSQMSDAEIIQAIYAERGRTDANGTLVHFSGSSPEVQQSVANRFVNEQRDALNALASENRQ